MDRLTARTENGNAYLVNVKPDEQEVDSPHKNTLQCILDCFERLALYEDTGLEPEEIDHLRDLTKMVEGIEPDRLREIVEAEKDGRLVVLPCKVGDTVYTVDIDCKDNPAHRLMCFCWNKSCKSCDKAYLRVWENRTKTADVRSIVAEMGLCGEKGGFGKTVFLTREEAEETLKGGTA